MHKLIHIAFASLLAIIFLSGCAQTGTKTPAPIKVKFVVITMFEIGEDSGDKAGEFQLWKERQKRTRSKR